MDAIVEKWHALCEKVGPVLNKIGGFFMKVWDVLLIVWAYVKRLRKIVLAAPIVWGAVVLALKNMDRLPETVGLMLQVDGTYAIEMSRELAVLGPVALTALCLLMMFCSKRTLTPWVVSAFTLVVPIFIWCINVFPS